MENEGEIPSLFFLPSGFLFTDELNSHYLTASMIVRQTVSTTRLCIVRVVLSLYILLSVQIKSLGKIDTYWTRYHQTHYQMCYYPIATTFCLITTAGVIGVL